MYMAPVALAPSSCLRSLAESACGQPTASSHRRCCNAMVTIAARPYLMTEVAGA